MRAPADPHLNRDIVHSLAIAALATLASGGLLYAGYLLQVWWTARRARCRPGSAGPVLLFGKRLVDGCPDPEFSRRIARAHRLVHEHGAGELLLGGGPPGATEADAAATALARLGLPGHVRMHREDASLDTLQNLRHARALLGDAATTPVLLLSSRTHLARCRRLARHLGLQVELCAAEDRLQLDPSTLGRLALEAGYLCWLDLGTRWARLIGHQRMIARVS